MIVLMDMEWIENIRGEKSVPPIGCLRVDKNWQTTDKFFTCVRPRDFSFYDWEHVGYTGGSFCEFLDAPKLPNAVELLRKWLADILYGRYFVHRRRKGQSLQFHLEPGILIKKRGEMLCWL